NISLKDVERKEVARPAPVREREEVQRPARIVGQKWAVVIGISSYQDTRIAGLRYAAADARLFQEWLVSREGGGYAPSRVRLLLDSAATAKQIRSALFNWLKQALEEDMVTIYFAGHGSPESPDSPGNLFLLPFDANYDDISTTGFPMWDIETALKRFIKAKKVVVIADACHSGGIGQPFDVSRRGDRGLSINPISSGLQNLSKVGDGVAVISAADDRQYSQESQSWGGGHGVFTYYLNKGLKGDADYNKDGRVTLGELIPYLSEQVRRETRNAQSPTVAGKFDPALSIGP
ncbi:MAG: caspase family protein, partial [Syntrophales bacterium]|nr:caspase family protein [Syntrophales bacterium]